MVIQMTFWNAIKLFSDEGLKSTGGLSNTQRRAEERPPDLLTLRRRPAMMQGLTSISSFVNSNDLRLMETIKSCDIFSRTTSCTARLLSDA